MSQRYLTLFTNLTLHPLRHTEKSAWEESSVVVVVVEASGGRKGRSKYFLVKLVSWLSSAKMEFVCRQKSCPQLSASWLLLTYRYDTNFWITELWCVLKTGIGINDSAVVVWCLVCVGGVVQCYSRRHQGFWKNKEVHDLCLTNFLTWFDSYSCNSMIDKRELSQK